MIRGKVNRTLKGASDIKELPLTPYNRRMGWDRGTPIDRYYIEDFLKNNSEYISGTVIEIGENTYTKKFGKDVEKSFIFTADSTYRGRDDVIIGDLQIPNREMQGEVDCFILSQTLPFIYNLNAVAENIVGYLKNGGYAIITLRGISQVSKYDADRWGDYWGFTMQSAKSLFDNVSTEIVSAQQYGNVKVAASFLYGMSFEEMKKDEMEYYDELFPVTIGLVIKKV